MDERFVGFGALPDDLEVAIAPPTKRWYVSAARGPIIHATRSGRSSAATRGLPSSSSGAGYAARVSVGSGV